MSYLSSSLLIFVRTLSFYCIIGSDEAPPDYNRTRSIYCVQKPCVRSLELKKMSSTAPQAFKINLTSPGICRRVRHKKKRNKAINIAYSLAQKLARGCELTGVRFPPDELEWHHSSGKFLEVSKLYNRSPVRFRSEIEGCVCVSIVAHRRFHAKTAA